MPKKIDWGEYVLTPSQSKRLNMLVANANFFRIEADFVDELLRDCARAHFKIGANYAKNGVDTKELWVKYASKDKQLGKSWG